MSNKSLPLAPYLSYLILTYLILYGLISAQNLLVPLAFAFLLATLLYPLCQRIERYLPWRAVAIILAFAFALLPVLSITTLFSWQFIDVYEEMPAIGEKLQGGFQTLFGWLNEQLHFTRKSPENWAQDNLQQFLQGPISFLGAGISSSSSFVVNFGLTFIYTFFILLYRDAFVSFIIRQSPAKQESRRKDLLKAIQQIGQQYFSGLSIVVLLLGLLNSLGLWLIGIPYALFWGFLAALLAIIPFIGTFLGGLLILLYTIAVSTTFWQPVAVIGWFAMVQFLEGNVISPKIIGQSVDLNPFAAILSLIIGGSIWGMAGMILAFPIMGMLKKLMEQFPSWAGIAQLLGKEIGKVELHAE